MQYYAYILFAITCIIIRQEWNLKCIVENLKNKLTLMKVTKTDIILKNIIIIHFLIMNRTFHK